MLCPKVFPPLHWLYRILIWLDIQIFFRAIRLNCKYRFYSSGQISGYRVLIIFFTQSLKSHIFAPPPSKGGKKKNIHPWYLEIFTAFLPEGSVNCSVVGQSSRCTVVRAYHKININILLGLIKKKIKYTAL